METVTELYSPAETAGLGKKVKMGILLLCAALALGLAGCVLLCLGTGTANAPRMEVAAMVTATLSGWAAMAIGVFVVADSRAQIAHAGTMMTGQRETVTGRVTITGERVRIPRSITLRTVLVTTGEGTRRVSVNERKAETLRGAGEDLTLYLVNGYVAAYGPGTGGEGEPPAAAPARPDWRSTPLWRTTPLGRLAAQAHLYILWALACVLFWGWVFTLVTDTAPRNKVTLFVDAYALEDTALAIRLETDLPDGIRMVKVHPVTYVMFGSEELEQADLFLLRASDVENYLPYLGPLPAGAGEGSWFHQGVPYGILVYDSATGTGPAQEYILYTTPEEGGEDYYLFYGGGSLHTGEEDTAALAVAQHLMKLE